MKTLLLSVIALILSNNVQATFIASLTGKIDPVKPARILVSGDPEKLGSLFVYSVLTKAQLFKEANKQDQIIIVGRSDDQAILTHAGYKEVESIRGLLKQGTVGRALEQVKSVKSLDVFAHSNATSGIVLDKNAFTTQFLEEIDLVWDVIKKKSHADTISFSKGVMPA